MDTKPRLSPWLTKPKFTDVWAYAGALVLTDIFTRNLAMLYLKHAPGPWPLALATASVAVAYVNWQCLFTIFHMKYDEAFLVAAGLEIAEIAALALNDHLSLSDTYFYVLISIIAVGLFVSVPLFTMHLEVSRARDKT